MYVVPLEPNPRLSWSTMLAHLGFYAARKDYVECIVPLPAEVNVCSRHDFISLGTTCDARPGEARKMYHFTNT